MYEGYRTRNYASILGSDDSSYPQSESLILKTIEKDGEETLPKYQVASGNPRHLWVGQGVFQYN